MKQKRPLIGPSRHLQPQLMAFEKKLLGATSFQEGEKWAASIKAAPAPKQRKVKSAPPALAPVIDKDFQECFGAEGVPSMVRKGKPSEEELARLRAFSAKKNEFLKRYKGEQLAYARTLFKK